jgi:hypothetical protein
MGVAASLILAISLLGRQSYTIKVNFAVKSSLVHSWATSGCATRNVESAEFSAARRDPPAAAGSLSFIRVIAKPT